MSPALPLSQPPAHVGILRLSAIGDVSHVVPVVRTMRRAWPDTRITWVVGRVEYGLLEGLEGVSFLVFDKRRSWASVQALKSALRGQSFDVLFHMQMAYRASWIALNLPADFRLGFHRALCKDAQFLFTQATTAFVPRAHVLDTFFGFLEALGIRERVLEWKFPIPQAAEASAATWLPEGQPYVVMQPCASARMRNYRDWPVDRYALVIDAARRRHGLQGVLVGGGSPAERQVAETLLAQAGPDVIDLVGKTNLKELLAVLRRAAAIVAPDSGPMHLANALGVPTVGLFAGSNPDRSGPYRERRHRVNRYPEAVRKYLKKDVDGVRWGQRVRHPKVMELIAPEMVLERLDGIVKARGTTAESSP